ncbi:MAG: response regulator [Desulfobacteraceae bacterium]|nr:response regulator [Desulfobacteraceae bacterium]
MISENNNSFSILIVDDQPKNIQLLGNLLKEHNYEVEFATNGKEAIDWVFSRDFDLILLDIMMPEMDGFQVCKKIKSNIAKRHIPIIFLTAKTDTEDIVKAFTMGGSDYVTKPFKAAELLVRVKMHVEMKILRGLIPICANCKDIRNDEGIWDKIEEYFENHSSALFSHSMCPKCADKFYGDQNWYKKNNNTP